MRKPEAAPVTREDKLQYSRQTNSCPECRPERVKTPDVIAGSHRAPTGMGTGGRSLSWDRAP